MKIRDILIIWIFSLISFQGITQNNAQDWDVLFKSYNVSDGLSHVSSSSISQDSDGFLWICTSDGLNRFDGYNFKIFLSSPGDTTSLINNLVNCFLEHSSGKIFVGTDQGACIYDRKREAFSKTGIEEALKPRLVIVEDSSDMREFLAEIFSNEYIIYKYDNGKAAFDKLKMVKPDIVISDVIMPIMDGIELCRRMKSDVTINHIPIILLTSRLEMDHKLQGLDLGADDYICKPFPQELLRIRVKNLLENKSRYKSRYSNDFVEEIMEGNKNKQSEEFLHTLVRIIQENIGSSEFGNTEFSKALGVSKSMLYKEIKRLTGNTPTEFIRSYRIKLAAKMLESEDGMLITEIIDALGFKSRTYFYKCFRKEYRMTPIEFRNNLPEKRSKEFSPPLDVLSISPMQ